MTATALSDPFQPHDHASCRRAALDRAEAECRARRLRLTPSRACVLEALLESHRALTAYELLDRLRAAGLGSQPPVVYRALNFLVAQGFVHRIERLSAFVACTHAGRDHAAAFLVCRECRTVAEASLPWLGAGLRHAAERLDFAVDAVVIEAEGLCETCRHKAP